MIGRGKIRNLLEEMGRLGIHRDDLEELFVRGSGAGGQKINKTSSTVVLRHIPTGLEVRCQQERSLSQNRVLARAELCEKLRARLAARKQASAAALSKKRAQTRKRTRSEKAAMIKSKRHRGETKSMRQKPRSDD
jgi:protein subunit release factor B